MSTSKQRIGITLLLFLIVRLTYGADAVTSHDIVLHELQAKRSLKDSTFFDDFPYDSYLDHCNLSNLVLIESDRSLMERNGRDGSLFLQNLFERSIKRYPVDPTSEADVKRVFKLADETAAFHTGEETQDSAYRVISGILLADLSDRVEIAISNRTLVKGNAAAEYVVSASNERRYYHQFPVSKWDKLWGHVLKGDFPYIAKRIPQELFPYRAPLSAAFALCAFTLVLVIKIHRRRRIVRLTVKKLLPKTSHSTTLVPVILFLLWSVGPRSAAQVPCSATLNRLSERADRSFYNGDMTVNKLYDGSRLIGNTVWFRRRPSKDLHAKYFADGDVVQKFKEFDKQTDERTLLVSVGGFTENVQGALRRPEGLTIDNGSVVNYTMNLKMDGLVIVYPDGGIAVSDIQRDTLTVQDGNKSIGLDIRESKDRQSFIDWAIRYKATVFQTQLLASRRGMLLDPCLARKEYRERRFLAVTKDRTTGEVLHVIVNVEPAYYLGDLTNLVYHYLDARVDVYGIYNIDVGDYNILFVYDTDGKLLASPQGDKPLSSATNLLVFYYQHQHQ